MSQEQGRLPRDAEVTESKIKESGALENCDRSYTCWGGRDLGWCGGGGEGGDEHEGRGYSKGKYW